MTELPNLSQLTHEQKDDLIRFLFAQVQQLSAQVAQLSVQVIELQGRLGKNSSNSSKPPSSDGLAKKKTSSLRQPSGKKPGGQKGHPGSTLKRMAEPTQTVSHGLAEQCDRCGQALRMEQAQVAQRRQVLDIVLSPVDVTEHQTFKLRCACGQRHESQFPSHIKQAVQYGPDIQALGVYLTQGQMLPYARTRELIEQLYGLTVSQATLVGWVQQAKEALQASADLIAQGLRQASVAQADESGLRIAGKLQWLHVVANENLTWYGIHAARGMQAIEEHDILTLLQGVLVHDCWAPYWQLDCTHALCNAHILRELLYIEEQTKQQWARQMAQFLILCNKIAHAVREQEQPLTAENMTALRIVYESIVHEGEAVNPEKPKAQGQRGRAKQSEAFNLLRRLRQHADSVLRFIDDPKVPFTNNLAERAIRMPKVKQKISGCFRTIEGAESFSVIRTCLDTLRKQGHSMFSVLQHAFYGNPITPTGC